jgi:hypothetical protein
VWFGLVRPLVLNFEDNMVGSGNDRVMQDQQTKQIRVARCG